MLNVTRSELPKLEDYVHYLETVWETAWLTNNGALLLQLEKNLKRYLKISDISLLSNGTLALQLALRALHLTGEVITTPYTFIATTNVLFYEGLVPVFADIDPQTYNLSPAAVEKKITANTSAILAVHVYGNPCDIEGFQRLASKYHLKLLYDAAHAFGVRYNNASVLSYGDASMLSFHATKVFNTIEGGAVVSPDKNVIRAVNLLRNFGIVDEEHTVLAGINAKMNEFQAAMGLCNLPLLDTKTKARKKIYERYVNAFSRSSLIQLQKIVTTKYNYAYMPIVLPTKKIRDRIFNALMKNGIKARKYFYPLVTNFGYVKEHMRSYEKDLPVARRISDGVLCLPLYSSLRESDVDTIIKVVFSSLK
jgi:dTDP-4-amino-4,6-dideoxygalactose transaminase